MNPLFIFSKTKGIQGGHVFLHFWVEGFMSGFPLNQWALRIFNSCVIHQSAPCTSLQEKASKAVSKISLFQIEEPWEERRYQRLCIRTVLGSTRVTRHLFFTLEAGTSFRVRTSTPAEGDQTKSPCVPRMSAMCVVLKKISSVNYIPSSPKTTYEVCAANSIRIVVDN